LTSLVDYLGRGEAPRTLPHEAIKGLLEELAAIIRRHYRLKLMVEGRFTASDAWRVFMAPARNTAAWTELLRYCGGEGFASLLSYHGNEFVLARAAGPFRGSLARSLLEAREVRVEVYGDPDYSEEADRRRLRDIYQWLVSLRDEMRLYGPVGSIARRRCTRQPENHLTILLGMRKTLAVLWRELYFEEDTAYLDEDKCWRIDLRALREEPTT